MRGAGDLQPLVERLVPGGHFEAMRPLSGGMSAHCWRLDVTAPGGEGRAFVLRQPAPGRPRGVGRALALREHGVLAAAHRLGLRAPRPLLVDVDGAYLPEPTVALEYVEGEMALRPPDPAAFGVALAEAMADVHRAPIAAFVGLIPLAPPWADPGAPPPGELGAALAPRWPRALGGEGEMAPPPPALIHRDLWPGNVLLRDGALVALLDWEDAALGDPDQDLAITRLDLRWILGPDAEAAFTARSAALRPVDPERLARWDLWAAHRLARIAEGDLAAWLGPFEALGRADLRADGMVRDVLAFVDEARAALGEG